MVHDIACIIDEIRQLLLTLDSDGGLLTPSVYETAQVLRFCPDASDPAGVTEWLLSQQEADGGWGDPASPLYRAVPTVAALLALVERGPRDARTRQAIAAGIEAFASMAPHWQAPLPDDLPIAAELVLPQMLDAARRIGLPLPTTHFAPLRQLGRRRRRLLACMRPAAATAPLHSWEAWGRRPSRTLLDGSGGVGHCPAATAWWLHLTRTRPHQRDRQAGARAYLAAAMGGSWPAQPGILPSAWPVQRFELAFVLHTLLVAGILHDLRLADVAAPLVGRLAGMVTPQGVGFSEHFAPDGDDTAAAVAVLAASGYRGYDSALASFQAADHFKAYPFEMHHAPTVTARGARALALCGRDDQPWLDALAAGQLQDGRWVGDKWNRSWLYTTAVVLHALSGGSHPEAVRAGVRALISHQHADGGWSSRGASSLQESAYAVLALNTQRGSSSWDAPAEASWRRARAFLARHFDERRRLPERLWIHKELYTPIRIDRAFLLSALLLALEPDAPARQHLPLEHRPVRYGA